jgi:hypothetical protein
MLENVMKLRTDVSTLKTAQKRLNSRVVTTSKKTDATLEEIMARVAENQGAIEESNAGISKLEQVVEENKRNADEERETLAGWAKQMLMILGIVLLILIVILLVLILMNKSRSSREHLKLEAKVDNNKQAIESEIRDALKKQDEEIAALKESVSKGK